MSDQSIFIAMIFIIGFLMMQGFVAPMMGSSGRSRKRLRERIRNLSSEQTGAEHVSLVRERYLKDVAPWERQLLKLPGMDALQTLVEQAGARQPAQRLLLMCLAGAVGTGLLAGLVLGFGFGALLLGALAGVAPMLWLKRQRTTRIRKFEEQLPDALTVIARALRAGLPFTEALNLVGQEMRDPAATEFGLVFTEINYGGDSRSALLALLERVPSVAVMAMVTSVLIQRDTGGNLAEVLDKLSAVVRERFRFQRSVRTLSAEGRLAGWILSLLPFFMTALLMALSPEFIPMLTEDPMGRQLIMISFGMIVVGILWLQRIVRIDV